MSETKINKHTGLGKAPTIVLPSKSKEAQLLDEIVWSTKRVGMRCRSARKDVRISVSTHSRKDGTKYETLIVSFRDGAEKRITSTGYIIFGVLKNRMYMKEGDDATGYKLTTKGGYVVNTAFKLTPGIADSFKRFSSRDEYSIKYDEFQDLYYIQLPEEGQI